MTVMFAEALLVLAQGERVAHDLVHVHRRARRVALAGERQQMPDDPGGALGFVEDGVEPLPEALGRGPAREPLGPGEDGRERVVQLVRDPGDGLAEHRHLLGLQELVIEVAGLIFELLPLADVAEEGVDVERAALAGASRVRRDFDPERGAVHPAEAEQIVGDGAVAGEAVEQCGARGGIDEALGVERADVRGRRVGRPPEEQFQVRVRCGRGARCLCEGAQIDALVDHLEEAGERFRGRGGGVRHDVSTLAESRARRRPVWAPAAAGATDEKWPDPIDRRWSRPYSERVW